MFSGFLFTIKNVGSRSCVPVFLVKPLKIITRNITIHPHKYVLSSTNPPPTLSSLFKRRTHTSANEKNENKDTPISREYLGHKCSDPEMGDLVYVGTISKSVKLVKVFSLTTSGFAIALLPILYKNFQLSATGSILAAIAVMMNFFVFLTPVLLHLLTKRYVTSIYYDEHKNQFTVTTISLFLQTNKLKFGPSDITIAKPSPFTSVVINNKVPLLVDPSLFVDREAMFAFMKYNDPIDWEIGKEEDVNDELEKREKKVEKE